MLLTNTIAIWTVDQRHSGSATLYQKHLSSSELAHAKRFRFDKDRSTFIIGRGILRHLLGYYTNRAPSDFQFEYGEQGKPYLKDVEAPHFNISHSGKLLVMGFCKKHPIGVDVEKIKTDFDLAELAKQHFSKREIKALHNLKEKERDRAFYRCWTRKESFIKAIGTGLSFPLDAFSVSLDDDHKAQMLETTWQKEEKETWQLASFIPAEGYLAAACVQDPEIMMEYHNWSSTKV